MCKRIACCRFQLCITPSQSSCKGPFKCYVIQFGWGGGVKFVEGSITEVYTVTVQCNVISYEGIGGVKF